MKSQVLLTVWCNITGEAAGEMVKTGIWIPYLIQRHIPSNSNVDHNTQIGDDSELEGRDTGGPESAMILQPGRGFNSHGRRQ